MTVGKDYKPCTSRDTKAQACKILSHTHQRRLQNKCPLMFLTHFKTVINGEEI